MCPIPFDGGLERSKDIPWAMSKSLSRRFSSAKASLSLEVAANVSLRRITSCSRALIYNSFLSRCVLVKGQLHDVAHCLDEGTSVPDDSAPVAVSWLVCYRAWVLFSLVFDHLAQVSYAQVWLGAPQTSSRLLLRQALEKTELC